MSDNSANVYRFAVALSFPGEHRDFVSNVARHLAATFTEDRVLYDQYHDAEFARANLNTYLPNLYRKESELIVIFLCPEYAKKLWCRLEWRHISQLIASVDEERIMFLSFGNPGDLSNIGILGGDGYIDVQRHSEEDIASKIRKRVSINLLNRTGPNVVQEETASDAEKIYGDVVALMRRVLANNPLLAKELRTLFSPPGDELVDHILAVPAVKLLADLHRWLKGQRKQDNLDDLRTIVNCIGVLGIDCTLVKSLRSDKDNGMVSISAALQGPRSPELLMAAIFNREPVYTSTCGTARGSSEFLVSRRVPSSGVFSEDRTFDYRGQLLQYFGIDDGKNADASLYEAMSALLLIDDPLYTVFKSDGDIPASLKKYPWAVCWFKLQLVEDAPWTEECARVIKVTTLLGRIYDLIDSLAPRQGQTQ